MMRPLIVIAGLLLILSGCATRSLKVMYLSDPPGAVLYSDNKNFGYTPKTIHYEISEEDLKQGHMVLSGTSVRWASGAHADIPNLQVDLSNGYIQQFIFNRPENYPGREVDMQFALELERLSIMKRQAHAQEEQARWLKRQSQRTYNCTSTASGNTINTTCD